MVSCPSSSSVCPAGPAENPQSHLSGDGPPAEAGVPEAWLQREAQTLQQYRVVRGSASLPSPGAVTSWPWGSLREAESQGGEQDPVGQEARAFFLMGPEGQSQSRRRTPAGLF